MLRQQLGNLDRVRGGGLLANSEAARAAIAANRRVLQAQMGGVNTLRGQQPGRTDAGFQTPPPAPAAQQPAPQQGTEIDDLVNRYRSR